MTSGKAAGGLFALPSPVLMFRGTQPAGNDINLSKNSTALVTSGPNAGGMTGVLFALLYL